MTRWIIVCKQIVIFCKNLLIYQEKNVNMIASFFLMCYIKPFYYTCYTFTKRKLILMETNVVKRDNWLWCFVNLNLFIDEIKNKNKFFVYPIQNNPGIWITPHHLKGRERWCALIFCTFVLSLFVKSWVKTSNLPIEERLQWKSPT